MDPLPSLRNKAKSQSMQAGEDQQCDRLSQHWGAFAGSLAGAATLNLDQGFKMQGVAQAIREHGNRIRLAILHQIGTRFTRFESGSSAHLAIIHTGLEKTVAEVLKAKGDEAGALYWCLTSDKVYDAVKHMTDHRVGSLVVVKPGDQKLVAGIITERDYLRKIIVQGRSPKTTRVGEIMTEENKLITVSSDTSILQAMQLMTDKHIRHVPVIDKKVVGMISIVDIVRAVVDQQQEEVKRLNDYIQGEYY